MIISVSVSPHYSQFSLLSWVDKREVERWLSVRNLYWVVFMEPRIFSFEGTIHSWDTVSKLTVHCFDLLHSFVFVAFFDLPYLSNWRSDLLDQPFQRKIGTQLSDGIFTSVSVSLSLSVSLCPFLSQFNSCVLSLRLEWKQWKGHWFERMETTRTNLFNRWDLTE